MPYELEKEMRDVCNLGEAIAKKSKAEGENKLGRLISKLIALGRSQEDINMAASDPQYREKLYAVKLYAELGIA